MQLGQTMVIGAVVAAAGGTAVGLGRGITAGAAGGDSAHAGRLAGSVVVGVVGAGIAAASRSKPQFALIAGGIPFVAGTGVASYEAARYAGYHMGNGDYPPEI